MGIKKALFNIKGMTRDLAASKFSPEFAYENRNMRILATDDNTSGTLVNEKGNLRVDTLGINGTIIGQAVLNDNLIIFVTDEGTDYIYKFYFDNEDTLCKSTLYSNDLNFSSEHPIESISVYENEKLQKIYWTDGLNQPRVINITNSVTNKPTDYFDFIRTLSLGETVNITRNAASSGVFAPGTIQYILAYHNLYGQQSNVCYTSPLYYISHADRGGSPTDTIGVSFTITVSTPDTKYNYLRVYALHRTSLNATPQARKVVDLAVPTNDSDIVYTDFGTVGEALDPTELLYIGGYPIKAGTLEQKDNTLFLGDITIDKAALSKNETLRNSIRNLSITFDKTSKSVSTESPTGYYTYKSQLSNSSKGITTYKRGETYRFGLQFQDKYGVWSDPLWIKDTDVTLGDSDYSIVSNLQRLIAPKTTITNAITTAAYNEGYRKVRPVVVFPTLSERAVVCQGVLCPTVYNVEDRANDSPTVMSSWFFRPNAAFGAPGPNPYWDTYPNRIGTWAEYRHNYPIPGNDRINSEIQCISNPPSSPELGNYHDFYTEPIDSSAWVNANREAFYIDRNIVTLHSPDIEFDTELRSIDSSNLKLRIVGCVPITAHISDIDIETSTPPLNYVKSSTENYPETASGFNKYRVSRTYENGGGTLSTGYKMALSGPYWLDSFYGSEYDNQEKQDVQFVVYPWHRHGSLNNTRSVKEGETKSAMLKHKKMSNLRYSENNVWLGTTYPLSTPKIAIFDSNENTIIRLPAPDPNLSSIVYNGNVDKTVVFHTVSKTSGTTFGDSWKALDPDTDSKDVDSGNVSNSYYPIIAINKYLFPSGEHSWASPETISNKEKWFLDTTDTMLTSNNNYYVRLKEINVARNPSNNEYKAIYYHVGEQVQSCSNDPVSIKYKSTPHAVISLGYDSGHYQNIIPDHFESNTSGLFAKKLFWDPNKDDTSASQYIPGWKTKWIAQPAALGTGGGTSIGYLWIAELYNDSVTNRFGGTTEEALESNNWVPAGDAYTLTSGRSVSVIWTEGDTYYQRYDCLKTYPYTLEDDNSVVEILSFMCETRVNIDGRYDRNRGQINNLYMTPTNFNLLNPVYTQRNNFFSYHGVNPSKLVLQGFPNTITWTKTKTLGEEIDTWTNITLASTLDLDGDLGKVRALRRFKDSLLAFQDNGISQILYNESVQIASTTGVPIEIANSGKVTGKRYISNKIGCTNKWSICSTPNGLYFYDGLSKDIYLFNGEFNNLSDRFGFHSWTVKNLNSIEPWTPAAFNGNITYYDKVNGEVLFITENDCLAFSEPAGQFTSFYDYGNTPAFANVKDRGIAFHGSSDENATYANYPYLHHEGNYNQFFDEYRPYGTTIVVNPNPTGDKVFNNLEFRADTFDVDNDLVHVPNTTFNTLTTWNEYQKGVAELTNTIDKPSTLKKKFRVWRANISRNTTNQGGSDSISYRRDRMRNPWLYLKLSMEATGAPNILESNYKTVLHDLVVDYFE